jgi:hypothetical protein
MPTDNKWIDKELLDDAFKAIDIFNEEGWEKGFDFLDVAKEKKERRKEIDESSGTYKIIKKKEYKIQEEEEINSEIGLATSVGNAILSGVIKIPYGWATLTTELQDAFTEDVPLDETKTAQLNNWFESTVLGEMMKYSEEKARATGAGRITEFLVQMYGNWKAVGKPAMNLTEKGWNIANKMIDTFKNGRYVKVTKGKELYKAAKKANDLNKAGGKAKKWVAVAVGGGAAGALVADYEDIGSFGDIFFEPGHYSAMDRVRKESSSDDAMRMLMNRLKLGGEMAFPIAPLFYGIGKFSKAVAKFGKNWAYSDRAIERFTDKYLLKVFRARSDKPQDLFKQIQRLEGGKASARNMTLDFTRRINYQMNNIYQASRKAVDATGNPSLIDDMVVKFLKTGEEIINKGRIIWKGFPNPDALMKSLGKLGAKPNDIADLIDNLSKVRQSMTDFKNAIWKGGNVHLKKGITEFNNIMNTRFKDFFGTVYKVFSDPKLIKATGFQPSMEAIEESAKVFRRYAQANKVNLSKAESIEEVKRWLKTARLDPITKTPEWVYGNRSIGADTGTITANIAKYITAGGKFRPDPSGGLIQVKSDLEALKTLFGGSSNAQTTIANTMADLGGIAARDNFYNTLKLLSDQAIKGGGRGLVYPTYNEAIVAFNAKGNLWQPTVSAQGLKLTTNLAEEYYTSPLDGMFTTENIAQALRLGEEIPLSGITKSLAYRYLFLIPKGLTQAGKTVLGPFTHGRNFISGAVTTISTGNILIPPAELAKAVSTAWRTIQPQTLYRITGNPKWLNMTVDQARYRFLLDGGMVNSSATMREVMGLIRDIGVRGDVMDRAFNSLGRKLKGFLGWAQDMYIAEDDFWKMFNWFGESYKIRRAWEGAIKRGVKNPSTGRKYTNADMPNEIDIMTDAMRTVRDTLPNYAYVSDFVKTFRRSILGNFVSWPAEIIRTTGRIMQIGLKEIKDPVLARNGWERLIGLGTAYAVIPPMTVEIVRGLYGITRDQLQAMRELIAPWSTGSTILPIRVKDEETGKWEYKYVDFSHGFFYDTVLNPIQQVISSAEIKDDEPLIKAMVLGMAKGLDRLVEPFISESIYYAVIADLLIRKGVKRDGTRVWNERADWFGEEGKLMKAIKHATYQMAPGSLAQMRRLYAAAMDKTLKGEEYEIPSEMLGFFGMRPVSVHPLKTLDFAIQDFNRNQRAERKLITEGLFRGDPLPGADTKLLRQFIHANEKRLETMDALRRKVMAALILGETRKEVYERFDRHGLGKLFKAIMKNKFKSLGVAEGIKKSLARQAKEKDIMDPYKENYNYKIIQQIEKQLKYQRLDEPFIINEDDWLPKDDTSQLNTPVLPQTPQVKVAAAPQINQQTGLTETEAAVLSPSEQVIARRT